MSPDQQSRLASVVLATLAGAGLASAANAADKNWGNTQPSASWNTPANWFPTGVPAAGDFANIINRTNQFQTITYDQPVGTSPVLGRLLINAESTGDLRFVMPADRFASLRTNHTTIGSTDVVTFRQESSLHEVNTLFQLGWGGTNGKATYELLGNGTTLNNLGESFIGGGGRAEFIQSGTAEHHVNLGLYISSLDQNTQNVYQMNGAALTAGQLWVGEFGNGSFSHGAGTVDAGTRLVIGAKPNSVGYYDQWQGTSVTAGAEQVGVEGTGTHNQRGGFANVTGELSLGVNPAGWGTYNINFGTLSAQSTVVGVAGRGTMFNDRGQHTTGTMTLAKGPGSNASYFLAHGATLSVGSDLVVGGAGSGAFNQNGGANSVARAVIIGDQPGSAGALGMSFGSLASQGAVIGRSGTGTMTIDGGVATFGSAVALGTGTNGVGRLNVASGSLTTGNLSVGDGNNGIGTVNQTGGSVRANHVIFVGNGTLASGTYTLSNGTLTTTNEYVGLNGRGVFTQAGGTHTVTERFGIRASPGSVGTFNLQGGTFSAGTFENHGAWHQTGGTARATWTVGGGQLAVTGGTFTTDRLNYSGQTFVTGNGTLRIDDGAGSNTFGSTMPFLEVRDTGRVDLTDKALVINYRPTDPNPMPALAQHVRGAYQGGAWDGPGIGSSQVPAGHGVGFAPGSVVSAFTGPFAGMNFDDDSAVFAVVHFGDGNLDGVVNLTDFNALAANFGQSGRGWWQGDFNYDGVVNLNDFNRLAANFGLGAAGTTVTPEDWAALGAAVPEPAVLPVALLAAGALRRRRRQLL